MGRPRKYATDEDRKIARYCWVKARRANKPEFLLTPEEVKQKLLEAGITIWDVGIGKGNA